MRCRSPLGRQVKFHFDCVFYYVSDLEQPICFYRDILGFALVSRDVVARFDLGGVLFELVPASARSKLVRGGNARLCLRVENVEKTLNELKERGVHVGPVQSKSNGVLGVFKDPDGNELCVWEYRD